MKVFFTKSEINFLKSKNSPEKIQLFLDDLKYRCEDSQLPAIFALRERKAHCLDGSLLAAAILRRTGHKPYIIDLCATEDDDHLICAYKWRKHWGAIAKSNFPGLRFREPIYKTPRELVMSYFELYFNLKGKKTLRNYSKPLALPNVRIMDWECDPSAIEPFLDKLEKTPHYNLLNNTQLKTLSKIGKSLMNSQMHGVNLKGTYKN